MSDCDEVVYRGFTITTRLFYDRNQWSSDKTPRFTWQYTIRGICGYRSRKLAIGFCKDYIDERMDAADEQEQAHE